MSSGAVAVNTVPPLKRLRRALRWRLIRAGLALAGLLPLGVALALGRLAGSVAWALLATERRRSRDHLARAFPELGARERDAIGRASFRRLGEGLMELTQLPRIDRRLETYVELDPSARAAIEGGLAAGRGVLAVTGHIGNWELLFRRFARAGYPAVAVGREAADPGMTAWIEKVRGEGRTIWRGEAGASRKLLRAFRENQIVAMLIDQDTKVQGVFVPFFGELAHTPRAPADLATRTGAAVVAVFVHARPGGGHVVTGRTLAADDEPLALTAAMTAAIEDEVRARPEDWVWMHRRWKTRPPEVP